MRRNPPRTTIPLALGLACSTLAAACGQSEPEPQGLVGGSNVVVVVIDTLRADHLATYGYSRSTAPFLEGIAEGSVVFDAAYGASTWTAPSTASLFTSLYPKDHGVWTGLWTFDVGNNALSRPGKHGAFRLGCNAAG